MIFDPTLNDENVNFLVLTDHPWIKEDGEAPDTPLDNAVLSRLKQFRAMNKFKKVALRVLQIETGFLKQKVISRLSANTLNVLLT